MNCRVSSRQVARGMKLVAKAVPTVSQTKAKFFDAYTKPVPAMMSTIINELLVSQHLWRYNAKYTYDPVFALGLVSVFDQILDGPEVDKDALFDAYVNALGESPAQYRKDAKMMEQWASAGASITPDASGSEGQQVLAQIKARVDANNFYYTRLFAVGLFRILESSGAKDPSALKGAIAALGIREDAVNKDLMLYKSTLSKLTAAKEMLKEFLERERKKTAERLAEKSAKVRTLLDAFLPVELCGAR
jgi:photosystem II biogenesis protein Psp29